jgi:hypothetical protein
VSTVYGANEKWNTRPSNRQEETNVIGMCELMSIIN